MENCQEKEPTEPNEDWEEEDEQALALIGLHLGTNLIYHIDSKKHAKYEWDGLNIMFGAKAKNQDILLKFEFYG